MTFGRGSSRQCEERHGSSESQLMRSDPVEPEDVYVEFSEDCDDASTEKTDEEEDEAEDERDG